MADVSIATTANSRFKKWRKMCKIHIFLSQEFLSLTENMPLRSSPLHEAAERQAVKKRHFSFQTTIFSPPKIQIQACKEGWFLGS